MTPFWKKKTLEEMSKAEWESLCDGCGRCCLNKFEDAKQRIFYTDVACKLLDTDSCRCSDYKNRTRKVKDCLVLTPRIMDEMNCLPPTCAYRRVHEGKDLLWWHPLVSGRRESVHEAGISVAGRCITEGNLSDRQIESRLVDWPLSTASRRPPRSTRSR
jgi:uncharacterized cysteine cluster protein YcgN (CxxCxxCC family)